MSSAGRRRKQVEVVDGEVGMRGKGESEEQATCYMGVAPMRPPLSEQVKFYISAPRRRPRSSHVQALRTYIVLMLL